MLENRRGRLEGNRGRPLQKEPLAAAARAERICLLDMLSLLFCAVTIFSYQTAFFKTFLVIFLSL